MPGMMDSFAQAFAEGLGPLPRVKRAAVQGAAKPPAPLPVTMQLCLPAADWDWPTDPNGSVSAALYEFVSYVPQRAAGWGAYAATTTRVSDSYSAFLGALEGVRRSRARWPRWQRLRTRPRCCFRTVRRRCRPGPSRRTRRGLWRVSPASRV